MAKKFNISLVDNTNYSYYNGIYTFEIENISGADSSIKVGIFSGEGGSQVCDFCIVGPENLWTIGKDESVSVQFVLQENLGESVRDFNFKFYNQPQESTDADYVFNMHQYFYQEEHFDFTVYDSKDYIPGISTYAPMGKRGITGEDGSTYSIPENGEQLYTLSDILRKSNVRKTRTGRILKFDKNNNIIIDIIYPSAVNTSPFIKFNVPSDTRLNIGDVIQIRDLETREVKTINFNQIPDE